MMKRSIFILIFSLLIASNSYAMTKDEALSTFVKANIAYKEGNYSQASALYESVREGGLESGPLYYNLGNSYFKQKALGKAILNYERALKLIPRDSDLISNYRYARSLISGNDTSVNANLWERIVVQPMNAVTLNELIITIFAALVVLAAFHLISLYGAWASGAAQKFLWTAVLVFIVGVAMMGIKRQQVLHQSIVITAAPAKFEPREEATTYFELHEGSKVVVLKKDGLWLKIRRQDGKVGWVPKTNIEEIIEHRST